MGQQGGGREVAAKGRCDPQAENRGQDEKTQDQDIDGLTDKEFGDPMGITGGRQFDHDGDDGDHNGEECGDDLGRIAYGIEGGGPVDAGEPLAGVCLQGEAEAFEPGDQEIEEHRRSEKRPCGKACASQAGTWEPGESSRVAPIWGARGCSMGCSVAARHYQRDPPETVRSCIVRPAASSRHKKHARAPISEGWINLFWGLAARASAI